MGVREAGESEGQVVIVWIGVRTLPHSKGCQLPAGLLSRNDLKNQNDINGKAAR